MLKSLIAMALGAALMAATPTAAETAQINGLDMYYEVHGEGPPLVLIHGAYMNISNNWGGLIPTLRGDPQSHCTGAPGARPHYRPRHPDHLREYGG